ncbi:MerR family DNA-binding transcriptional regulator [Oscillospiraceae bacterium HV4-5-C5C]|nr:MerR family DNA-binding transcriptional regulator [Oscillospiraceae bacterium HV4-5-C5C]
MVLNEASRASGLTRKAIEYYIEQGLIQPQSQDHGYRDFSAAEV